MIVKNNKRLAGAELTQTEVTCGVMVECTGDCFLSSLIIYLSPM